MNRFFRTAHRAAVFASAGLLVACASSNLQSTGKAPGAATPTPVPADTRPSPEKQPPSVLIQGRTANAVLDDIVKYRTGRGMALKVRTGNRVEFTMAVQKVKDPTEARMRYQLTPGNGNLLLSARVFQVSNPGTGREQITEITNEVASQLERELAGYAQTGAR